MLTKDAQMPMVMAGQTSKIVVLIRLVTRLLEEQLAAQIPTVMAGQILMMIYRTTQLSGKILMVMDTVIILKVQLLMLVSIHLGHLY